MEEPKFALMMKIITISRGYKKHGGDLTKEDLYEVWNKQKGICPFTGVKLIIPTHTKTNKKIRINSLYRASVDRIDNKVGYTKNNIQFVSQMYNFAKNTNTNENVIKFCEAIMKNIKNEQ